MNMTSYTTNFDHVKTFMKTFGQDVKDSPELPDKDTISLRIELIAEELNEYGMLAKIKILLKLQMH